MSTNHSDIEIVNNLEKSRFEAILNGKTAIAEYKLRDGQIFFTHVEVPEDVENQGVAAKLAQTGMEYARKENLKVLPYCTFFIDYIKRHPEYRDVLAPRFAERI